MLPLPISELVPFAVPDALLEPALLDRFAASSSKMLSPEFYLYLNLTRICIPNPTSLFLFQDSRRSEQRRNDIKDIFFQPAGTHEAHGSLQPNVSIWFLRWSGLWSRRVVNIPSWCGSQIRAAASSDPTPSYCMVTSPTS